MTTPELIKSIETAGKGTFAKCPYNGNCYVSPHLYNDAAYNLHIAAYDNSHSFHGWRVLDATTEAECARVFGDAPESPGEFCTLGK